MTTRTVLLTEAGALRCQMWETIDEDDGSEAQCANNARHAFRLRNSVPPDWIILACKEHYGYAIRCGNTYVPYFEVSDGLL